MALGWNEIRENAIRFSKEWKDAKDEDADGKSFWDGLFNVFGVPRQRVATFEKKVNVSDGKRGSIDLLWKGVVLIEHKSKGKDLDKAYKQATDYFPGLKDYELPKYIIVCDFARFRIYDLTENTTQEFPLEELQKNVQLLGFIAGYQKISYKKEDPVNIEAAELMGKVHDLMKEAGYTGHALEQFLVRLVFCMFAEDTAIFNKNIFMEYLINKTHEDGSDIGAHLSQIFYILNQPWDKRMKNIDESLGEFPYVNGKLFEEVLPPASFDREMRNAILNCCALDWSKISPAIFGSLFQSVMDPELRRNLGAHYTSETNILKLIKPLFLDALWEEFNSIKNNHNKLIDFHKKLANLQFLDPACGCGNFLVITYRELRLLEIEVLKLINKTGEKFTNISTVALLDVDQMYGIEIEEFPVRIAEVALWLTDHQMNQLVSLEFGQSFARLPLKKSATIVHANALRMDWQSIVRPKIIENYFFDMGRKAPAGKITEVRTEFSYILGNPPFVGKHLQNEGQKEDSDYIFQNVQGSGVMDYVTCWYIKAAQYMQDKITKTAFVSTNSVAQGEQVGILWGELFQKYHCKIHFAHRTFKWTNEAKGQAAVYVVVIGFAASDANVKKIYDYETVNSLPHERIVKNINPYLIEGKDIWVTTRKNAICPVPELQKGSQPTDNGFLLFTDEEKIEFIKKEPLSKKYIKPFVSAREFLHNEKRWCLWLVDTEPTELKKMPFVLERVENVRKFRLKSTKAATVKWADRPTLFTEIRQPESTYILIPRVSSENRKYIPMAFLGKDSIVSDTCISLPRASMYHFGILTSKMHMTWMKYVCGRLKSDFRYSNDIVYNNFPWPESSSEKKIQAVEDAAQNVLDVRNEFPDSSLADLYDPTTMPPALTKAHNALDKAVDKCYRSKPFESDAKRMEFLFELYEKYTAPLVGKKDQKSKA